MRSLKPTTAPLLPILPLAFTAMLPTTLHFFPRTSCNAGTSLGSATVLDLYADNSCHSVPAGTETIYVDGIADGCAVKAYADFYCNSLTLLSLPAIALGNCWWHSEGNGDSAIIGSWMGVCDYPTTTNASFTFSLFSTTSVRVDLSTVMVASMTSYTTAEFRPGSTVTTMSPGLQETATETKTSAAAEMGESGWWRRRICKALLMMGSVEVMWAITPV